jgi:ParB-like chromosome segregation protein Spo0J
MSTEQVARMVGKPPAHIATVVRVLNLPKSVRDMLDRGEITALHARALLESHNPDAIAREIIARRLDIYQTEQLVRTAAQHAGDVEKVSLEAVDLDIADPNTLPNSSPESDGDAKSGDSKADVASAPASVSRDDVSDEPAFPARDIGKLSQEKFEPADDVIAFEDEDIAILEDAAEPETNVTILPDPANDVSKTVTLSEVAKADDETESEVAVPNTKSSSDGGEVVTTELLERHLARLLGIKVAITENENVGAMTLHYSGREQLSDIVARLNSSPKR